MKTIDKQYGIIAILDALGASTYGDKEIKRFMQSRDIVVSSLQGKSNRMSKKLTTFTFNDTVLVVLESESKQPSADEIEDFLIILRKFLVDSLFSSILFRGAFAIGAFYKDEETNTILGEAVTDAATWYDKADWIGIISTPRTSIYIDYLREKHLKSLKHLILNYDVPMSNGKAKNLKTVNWPKMFWVSGNKLCQPGESKRETLFNLLGKYTMPEGTDKKYFHAIEYFNHVMKEQKLVNRPQKH
jgi:hypothetical protein